MAGAPNNTSCMNTTFTPGIKMHQFPADPTIRRKWVKFVQRHRVDFSEPVSKYASLCSAHFEEECYERRFSSLLGEGNDMKSVLKKGSVPTKVSVVPKESDVTTERQKRKVNILTAYCNSDFCLQYINVPRFAAYNL